MPRIKVVPRKSPSWVLTPTSRPHTPSSGITIQDASSNPQYLSEKNETRPTSSQDECQSEDEEETETDEEEEDDDVHEKLIYELKFFQQWGLMNKRDPNEVTSGDDDEALTERDQCYGLEVTRRYPTFFLLIPQRPHYEGLLHDNVDEGIKKTVYKALWYKLVNLMDQALHTNGLSSSRDIKEMMEEARGLEKLGFDTRHLMARLEQPSRSIFDLSLANDQLRLAKKRKSEMEEQLTELDMLEAEADKMKKMMLDVEARVSQLKAKVGSNEERAALMKSLRKEVWDAERIFRAKLDIFKSLD